MSEDKHRPVTEAELAEWKAVLNEPEPDWATRGSHYEWTTRCMERRQRVTGMMDEAMPRLLADVERLRAKAIRIGSARMAVTGAASFVYRIINQGNVAHHIDSTWGEGIAEDCRQSLKAIGDEVDQLREEVKGLRRVKEAFIEQTANLHALQYAAQNGKGGD